MSKNDDGEYELVLGNRQLLSAFFIVVILFGVFFTMGYIVGRNSAPSAAASAPPQSPAASVPAEGGPANAAQPSAVANPRAESSAQPVPAGGTAEAAPEKTDAAPQPSTHAVASSPETAAPPRETSPAERSTRAAAEPGPGQMYLQVAAVAQPQAGAVVDTLKQKGFPARLGDSPNGTVFRVLVGPYADTAALGKAKADLENAGFRPIVRK